MNYSLFRTINGWAGGSLDPVMKLAASDLIFVLFAAFALLAFLTWRRDGVRPVLAAGVTLAAAFALGLVAATLHAERRPFETHRVHVVVAHAAGQSFPSDHATAAFALALAAIAFFSRRWGALLLVGAVLVGFARVYDGIHYPGDILGSLLVALLGLLVGSAALRLVPWPSVPRQAPARR